MAKLKCDQHSRRVLTVRGRFVHRGGWGDVCDSPTASIGGMQYTAKDIEEAEKLRTPEQQKKSWLQLPKKP